MESTSEKPVAADQVALQFQFWNLAFFTGKQVFVFGEENGSQSVALTKAGVHPFASFYKRSNEFTEKLHLERRMKAIQKLKENGILFLEGVDATHLELLEDLPFRADKRPEGGGSWVLWWQCPFANSDDPSTTRNMLISFLSSAAPLLRAGDLIVIGWALNWEDPNLSPRSRSNTYNISGLVAHGKTVHLKTLVEQDEAIGKELIDNGYTHSTNPGAPSLYGSWVPTLRTLVLEKVDATEEVNAVGPGDEHTEEGKVDNKKEK